MSVRGNVAKSAVPFFSDLGEAGPRPQRSLGTCTGLMV